MRLRTRWSLPTLAAFFLVSGASAEERLEFNRDIRPILSDKCFACHGPDEKNRLSGLRLDLREGATKDLGDRVAVAPGEPEQSEVVKRITHENEALRMPPAYSGKKLTEREIGLLRRWIDEGAEYQGHWSFLAPKRPPLPPVSDPAWPRNPIDFFAMARLDREGLKPSPEASRETLIRRVSFDITGLPPTLEEIDAFLADDSPNAYEKVVDRLLESPRYGERMAIRWLDASRYADTNGYQTDAERVMWRWRDWVIDAFNDNKPFDRFTIEQIAGDLLPHPTTEQIVATGFSRNHRGNSEGGIVPEEYLVEYSVDRVETTSTVFLGLTLGCSRCHDHKFDPLSQREFYQFYAYFNNIPERGRIFKFGNTPPLIAAPTDEQKEKLAALDEKLQAAERRFAAVDSRKSLEAWQPPHFADWAPERDLVKKLALNGAPGGVKGEAARFDGSKEIEAGDEPNFGYLDKFTISAWVRADSPNGAIVSKTDRKLDDQGYGFGGWGLYLIDGKLKVLLVTRWLDDSVRVATEKEFPLGEWHHVAASYDGSRFAKGVKIYVDGEPWETSADLDFINQEIRRKAPVLVGNGGGLEKGFEGLIDEVRLYDEPLPQEQVAALATAKTLDEIAATPRHARAAGEQAKLRLAYLERYGPGDLRQAWDELTALRRERADLLDSFPTVMVMQELPEPRPTHILERGAYDAPGAPVGRGVPETLPPLPDKAPNDRLGLAQWLVSAENPLTARVTVNRFWQMLFGRGIVKTVEDFGSQGEWPTHPALLDWLAVEFMDSGWDVKNLIRTIVTSATYRQSSRATPELIERDPENRLLARGPRMRLSAEMVRDQALAISGLLVEDVGGPSAKPYQPEGLWQELAGGSGYEQDHGEGLYRRSLYTFWKRTSPPPFMMNFDSAGRETCTVRQTRTNTPLQALNLMNDVTYVEAARVLAERMMTECGSEPAARIDFGFRLATSRHPDADEREVLLGSFQHYRDRFQSKPQAAEALLSEGERPRDESLDPVEHAAYAAVASLILNLDETITKE